MTDTEHGNDYNLQRRIDRAYAVAQTSLDPADWRYYHALQGAKDGNATALKNAAYALVHGPLGDVDDLPPWGDITEPGGHSTLP